MNETVYSIQKIPEEERPRERLLRYGAESITTTELIAIILGSGMRGLSVMQLAQDIVIRFGNMQNLADASIEELCQIKGLGRAKALQLKAAIGLGVRVSRQAPSARYRIKHPDHAYNLVKDDLEHENREIFIVILLDSRGCAVSYQVVAIGSLSHAYVHPREVFYPAIRQKAQSIIVAHNHPSGDPTPSKDDFDLTKTLIDSGELLSIPLRDHLIIGGKKYVSMRSKVKFPEQ